MERDAFWIIISKILLVLNYRMRFNRSSGTFATHWVFVLIETKGPSLTLSWRVVGKSVDYLANANDTSPHVRVPCPFGIVARAASLPEHEYFITTKRAGEQANRRIPLDLSECRVSLFGGVAYHSPIGLLLHLPLFWCTSTMAPICYKPEAAEAEIQLAEPATFVAV